MLTVMLDEFTNIIVHIMASLITDEEVDGQTLLCLTEGMIGELLPTMKKRILLSKAIKDLKQPAASTTSLSQ